ncbi:molybdopterin-dependent oxidoreductase [Caulobacter mirabilis]|uniref:Molybdopterin-dependent oxidoreductase n=1 Tax=Caulobacter mirabilis TaxID=69666 RepID=A0A2D2AWF0_9CAUL|nr:molybdopterin-dependent oxidoreductase [Caulobacter mirabilis]ATQ42342.1 molybdopterin-dependent oxidoreductase [Caulobacter mirabilis]
MRALLAAAVLLLAPVAAGAQSSSQTLTVTNADGKATIFTAETLKDLPRAKALLGGKRGYEGTTLSSVLREAGVVQGPRLHGKPMAAYVVVVGKDGYRAVLSLAETDPSFRDAPIILADRKDEGPLAENEGPWRLVIGADARPDRGVRQVETVSVVLAP